mgnify:CR=1 FL=1
MTSPPFRRFLEEEPQTALRVLLTPAGAVHERTVALQREIFSEAFAGQPCGTVVNAAAAPGGGTDLLAVVQVAAAERGDARLGAPDGPALAPLPLPYAIPAASEPRKRIV